jgi:RimJ/RimL family protein N-acetyltransferase
LDDARDSSLELVISVDQVRFGRLASRRLEAEVDPRNVRSARVLKQLGFTQEGLLRERWMTRGVPCSVNAYGLLQREWKPLA